MLFKCVGAKLEGVYTWEARNLKSRNIRFDLYTSGHGYKGIVIEYQGKYGILEMVIEY